MADWPVFTFDPAPLEGPEATFLTRAGVLFGSSDHLDRDELQELRVALFCEEALKTSEIEGEFLDRNSLQISLRQQFGMNVGSLAVPAAEQGIAEMTVAVYRTWKEPLTHAMLFAWHTMLTKGRRDLDGSGCYRTGDKPMQVVSGAIGSGRVHFEAPPSAAVASEMDAFLKWFKATAPGGGTPLPALTRAGIAHLWFVAIHPFEDGNGRLGRAIAEKALAQTQGMPSLIALAQVIGGKRKAYYAELEAVNRTLEITGWLVWFAQVVLDAQELTIQRVRFIIQKAKFYDRFRDLLNPRQSKVIARMFREGVDGFEGGLSAHNYIRIAGTSASTATRDLHDLVVNGALTRSGDRKYARYHLNFEATQTGDE